jgi:glycosyltransferase involved in cell wall biosynthesis
MSVSVLIPTHNAARTIRSAIDSALRQTAPPDEVIVLDDGSTDDTIAVVESYGPRLRLIRQKNQGVAHTRNRLCAEASCDLLAFLDHDDIWHPTYLEVQERQFAAYPELVALFAGSALFYGYGDFTWPDSPMACENAFELIDSLSFLGRYNQAGTFGCASFMCVPKRTFARIGPEPFKVDAAEDAYFCTWLPLLGPVGYTDVPLVAYRVTEGATSTDQVRAVRARLEVLTLMEPHYRALASPSSRKLFQSVLASKRRHCAKHLFGVGKAHEARGQLYRSLAHSPRPASLAKSMGLLAASLMPVRFQPAWPSAQRNWRDPTVEANRATT